MSAEATVVRNYLDVLLGLNCETELHIEGRKTHHDLEGHEDHDHDEFASFHVELPEAEEARLLQVAHQYEQAADVLSQRPKAPLVP